MSCYTLDNLVVLMRVRRETVDRLCRSLEFGACVEYGTLERDWMGYSPGQCRYNYTIRIDEGASYYLGVQPNADKPSEYWVTVRLDFNPAKVGQYVEFDALYYVLIVNCRWLDFKRFDVAVDYEVPRERVKLIKDKRKYTCYELSEVNKTEYLGNRSTHGQVKLYNKQLESKLTYALTRLEITVDYAESSWQEFKRLWPRVFALPDVIDADGMGGTDYVLLLACADNPEYLMHLPFRRRKKIAQLLESTAQFLRPDEISYKLILSQILEYGNRFEPEKFVELEDDAFEFEAAGEVDDGEQMEME